MYVAGSRIPLLMVSFLPETLPIQIDGDLNPYLPGGRVFKYQSGQWVAAILYDAVANTSLHTISTD